LGRANARTRRLAVNIMGFLSERRTQRRVSVHWPVRLVREKGNITIDAQTGNISSGGFYFHSSESLDVGEILGCGISMPSWNPGELEDILILQCKVQVKWVHWDANLNQFGVGCQIQTYSVTEPSRMAHTFNMT
jgi:hypothetical protein